MLVTRPHHLFTALSLGAALALAGCGDDETKGANCGPGTVEQNGQCVPEADTTVTPDTSPADTSQPADTTAPPQDTATSQPETEVSQPETNNECTPEEAGQGVIGSPCTKDCQCGDDNGETKCYDGFYMAGFRFCTLSPADGRTSNFGPPGYATLQFPSDCYPSIPAPQRPTLYSATCDTIDDCRELGAQYTHCGTSHLDYHSGGGGTQCPTQNSARDLTLRKTCIIDTLPPFNRGNL